MRIPKFITWLGYFGVIVKIYNLLKFVENQNVLVATEILIALGAGAMIGMSLTKVSFPKVLRISVMVLTLLTVCLSMSYPIWGKYLLDENSLGKFLDFFSISIIFSFSWIGGKSFVRMSGQRMQKI